jgi:multidrug resistance efflux pump
MFLWNWTREEQLLKVYSLHEITDSRVLYDKNPPKFMVLIILIVLSLIVGFLVWADVSIKTYVVKAQGIVTADNKTNIMTNITGQLSSVNVKEGQKVKAGDVLFTINPSDSNLQLEQANAELKYDNERIALLTRAEKDAAKGTNSFNKNNPNELEFYNRLQDNYAKEGEYTVDVKALKAQGYTDDMIKQQQDQAKTKLNELHYDTILSFTTEKDQDEADAAKVEGQIDALKSSLSSYKITAETSGIVHLVAPLTTGTVIQQGNSLGSISDTSKGIIIETLLQSSDRPMVSVGDDVSIAVLGLNQEEYGTIKGKVVSIDQDADIDSQKGTVYFNLKVKPEKTFLKDRKGQKVNLALGMTTETRVDYDKITYMKYFLEQIGIKFD